MVNSVGTIEASLASSGHVPAGSRIGKWVARSALVVLAAVISMLLSSLMVSHWAPLPVQAIDSGRFVERVAALTADADTGEWSVFHVLYTKCPCSKRVFDHVTALEPIEGTDEVYLLVGDEDEDMTSACERNGSRTVHLTSEELSHQFGIESAPLFFVVDPEGDLAWIGGYTSRKQGLDYAYTETLAELRAGGEPEPRPVFGCGVSSSLQAQLDPLGIKY